MDLHVDSASAGHGEVGHRWFRRNMRNLYAGRLGATPWFASVCSEEKAPPKYFMQDTNFGSFLEALRASPFVAQLIVFDEDERGRMGSVPAGIVDDYRVLSAALACDEGDLADPEFCSYLVDSLAQATAGSNPAFGRIEYGQFSDRSNLDIALRRKSRRFLPESRTFLRGYAWVTVCPEELLGRLGGCAALRASGAFFQVAPLSSGGALLRATESLAEYSDETMRQVFKAVAKVLPPGMPRAHAAFPGLRFVNNDASAAAGERNS